MSARRGAVRVNPVTGKMERVEPSSSTTTGDGKHRDGCMLIDDKYVNAARDLGLGGQAGALRWAFGAGTRAAGKSRYRRCHDIVVIVRRITVFGCVSSFCLLPAGMYDHIKSLARMNASDVPTGSSMEREAPRGGSRASNSGGGGGRKLGSGGSSTAPTTDKVVDAKNMGAVADVIRTTTTKVGRARVACFASTAPGMAAVTKMHQHADDFQRRKGVVNTLGGAKDVNRQNNALPVKLPPKGSGARIATFDTVETCGAEGQRRAENRAKRDAANSAKGKFPQLHGSGVHVLGGPSAGKIKK